MGLRVNTNIASLGAQRNLSQVTGRLRGNMSRLSSGLRIATAADDAAGLAISERMRSQIRSLGVATRNAQDGISLVQTAEGALDEVSNLLGRMRELSVQAANGTLTSGDRGTINTEMVALQSEMDRISRVSSFNGVKLLNGAATVSVQVGINAGEVIAVELFDTDTTAMGIDTTTVNTTTAAAATASLALLDGAIGSINSIRGGLGATQNRLQSSVRSIMNGQENLSAAESRIRDVDVAFETADLARNTILQQAATSVLQQANVQPQIALSLLQS